MVHDPLDEAPPPIPIEEYHKLRRMYTHVSPHEEENILIIDSAADISCVGQGFAILFQSGEKMILNTALASAPSNTFDIVTAAAVVSDPSSSKEVIIVINQAVYIPDLKQHESLLHSDQARHHNVQVNDIARCFYDCEGRAGRQNIEVEGTTIPLKHDGRKYFLSIREPREEDWDLCQVIELTSPESWNSVIKTRRNKRLNEFTDEDVKRWSQRLGRLNLETTKYTLMATTQLVSSVEAENRMVPRRHFKCRLPCLRPRRLSEGFSSDTFFPSMRSTRGYTCAQIFVGSRSGYTYVMPLKNKAYAYTALQDFIREVGAPQYLAVDAAREENLGEWLSICRRYCIPQHTSEPSYQNQNRVERRIQDVKRRTMVLMSTYSAPSRYWDYGVEYSVELINHTAVRKLGWRTPYEALHGDTPDISVFRYTFYEPVYYLEPNVHFPNPNMLPGRFMGIARTTGDAFTFIVMTDDGIKSIALHRSVIRHRDNTSRDPYANYNIDSPTTDVTQEPDPSTTEPLQQEDTTTTSPEDCTPSEEIILDDDAETIIFAGNDHPNQPNTGEVYNHFDAELRCDDIDDIISSKFDDINGKLYIKVRWKNNQESYISAELIQHDDPARLAHYIRDNPVERLRNGFWSQWAARTLQAISNSTSRIRRMYSNVKLGDTYYPYSRRVIRRKKIYPIKMQTFMGVEIPRNSKEAIYLDKKNGDNKWGEAMGREIGGIQEHKTLLFLPPGADPPEGYQEVPLRMIFDVKPDLRRKARLVAGGHLIDARGHSSYSSVVRLDSIRLLNVIAKAQGLKVLAGDVGNAYLNADTKEKVFTRCGPEFGPKLEGRIAIIKKSLYGLKSSGARWHAHFAQTLHTLGFQPTRFDNDVWIKRRFDGSGYDYISTYVDDFLITAQDPWIYMKRLQEIYVIKEPKIPDVYLGATYTGDPSGNWSINAKQYIRESIRQIEQRLGIQIREEKTPMKTNDHPEEDDSPILNNDMHREYQSLVGMLQWAVSLCRIDVCYAVSSMSRFCSCPREGHFTRLLRIWGYLKKYPSRSLRISEKMYEIESEKLDINLLDFSEQYLYANEEIDKRFPRPLGQELSVSVFFDSDHAHDKTTSRSISGVIVLVGSTPVIWRSKRQGAVQTSTYGAEFSAMRLATEEAITIRYMLRSLGIHVSKPTDISGDNAGVIVNATMPEATLKKKHIALSYHSVRESVASGIIHPSKVSSKNNIADLLTKPLERCTFMGHTGRLLDLNSGSDL